jgi:hypothetical protein
MVIEVKAVASRKADDSILVMDLALDQSLNVIVVFLSQPREATTSAVKVVAVDGE